MSAATNAKKVSTRATRQVKTPLDALREAITTVVEKISTAYEAAKASTEVETLLQILDIDLLPRAFEPLHREPLTAYDVDTTYDRLFAPLAVLQGAIALSQGSALEQALQVAYDQLDDVHSQLDSAGEIATSLPPIDFEARDFDAGRDLAVELLKTTCDYHDSDLTESKRWCRLGAAQVRITRPYLEALVSNPALIEGFDAVMSAWLGCDSYGDPEELRCPRAEYETGTVGGDGTEPFPDGVLTDTPERVVQPTTAEAPAANPVCSSTVIVALPIESPDFKIASCLDLSFVSRRDGPAIRSRWSVPHDKEGYWADGIRIGRRYFAEVATLASKDEDDAKYAITFALNDHGWTGGGWGIETGFSEALAEAAILGLRVARSQAKFGGDWPFPVRHGMPQ